MNDMDQALVEHPDLAEVINYLHGALGLARNTKTMRDIEAIIKWQTSPRQRYIQRKVDEFRKKQGTLYNFAVEKFDGYAGLFYRDFAKGQSPREVTPEEVAERAKKVLCNTYWPDLYHVH